MPRSAARIPALPRSTGAPSRMNTKDHPVICPRVHPLAMTLDSSEGRPEPVRTSTDAVFLSSSIADRPSTVCSAD